MNPRLLELDALVYGALELPADSRRHAADRINEWLRSRRGNASEVEREQTLRWLDEKPFASLRDRHGKSCRAEAVELVLSLGYPHALLVSPEALASARVPPESGGAFEPVGHLLLPLFYLPLLAMAFTRPEETGCIRTGLPALLWAASVSGLAAWVLRFGRKKALAMGVLSGAASLFAVLVTAVAGASGDGAMRLCCAGAVITFTLLAGVHIAGAARSFVRA